MCIDGKAAIAEGGASARDRRHDSMGNFAHAAITGIGEIEVAGRVEGEAQGGQYLRVQGSDVFGNRSIAAGDRIDGSGGDPADTTVAAIGNVEVTLRVEGEAEWHVELRTERWSSVAAVAGLTDSGDRSDHVVGDLGDTTVTCIKNEEGAGVIEQDSTGRLNGGDYGGSKMLFPSLK